MWGGKSFKKGKREKKERGSFRDGTLAVGGGGVWFVGAEEEEEETLGAWEV